MAKLAAGVAKPGPGHSGDGVCVVDPGAEGAFMRRFALGDLPGIGPKTAEWLGRAGLHSVEDVLREDAQVLASRLGERDAEWLGRKVRGIDDAPVTPRTEPKSMSRDATFAHDLVTDEDLGRELLALVDRATGDMREDGLLARTITVKLRDWDFTTRQASRTLPQPVLSDRAVYAVARELLRRLPEAHVTFAGTSRGIEA